MENVALSNTTANHPTKFYDCIFSNFKVYSESSGKWRSVFLHSQGATVQQNYNCAPPDDHAIWLNEPTYSIGRTDANAFPLELYAVVVIDSISPLFLYLYESVAMVVLFAFLVVTFFKLPFALYE